MLLITWWSLLSLGPDHTQPPLNVYLILSLPRSLSIALFLSQLNPFLGEMLQIPCSLMISTLSQSEATPDHYQETFLNVSKIHCLVLDSRSLTKLCSTGFLFCNFEVHFFAGHRVFRDPLPLPTPGKPNRFWKDAWVGWDNIRGWGFILTSRNLLTWCLALLPVCL